MTEDATPKPIERPRRAPVPIVLFLVLGLVLLFFFGWYLDWFGRDLTDDQILEHLAPSTEARQIQHALVQLEQRLSPRYHAKERFREALVALKSHPRSEVRTMVAQVMGREPADVYQAALLEMLSDSDPPVRRNVACALSNFNHAAARPELLLALKNAVLSSPVAGTLDHRVKVGSEATSGRDLARVTAGDIETHIRPAFNGRVLTVHKNKGDSVQAGDALFTLAPDPASVVNVLLALSFVGTKEDVEIIRPFVNEEIAGMAPEVRDQAIKTLDALARK